MSDNLTSLKRKAVPGADLVRPEKKGRLDQIQALKKSLEDFAHQKVN